MIDTLEAMSALESVRPGEKLTRRFVEEYERRLEERKKSKAKKEFQLIYRVSITPTLVYYYAPT